LVGCGYHTTGSSSVLPKEVRSIAVMPWGNNTNQYKLANLMAEAMSREFISRTRYNVVADPSKADAVLTGTVVNLFSNATVLDPATGRGTGAQVLVQTQVRLTGKDGKVLFFRPNLEFRDRYEISVDPKQYLDESQATLERISRDVARAVVSAVLESF
jgi:hypothetical protein